jgi:hypothetical protein
MKTRTLIFVSILTIALPSCQLATATPISTPTPPGQMETKVAATIYADVTATASILIANQTSTAAVNRSPFQAALTADALTSAVRMLTPTAAVFNISLPADACWMNSGIDVHTGRRVTMAASGIVNTYGGRDGSSNDPNGQTGVCGAIQCPLQGAGYGALIGRVDDGKTFLVGTNLEFVPTRDGQLHFTVNDWECEDNSGVFDLVITIP